MFSLGQYNADMPSVSQSALSIHDAKQPGSCSHRQALYCVNGISCWPDSIAGKVCNAPLTAGAPRLQTFQQTRQARLCGRTKLILEQQEDAPLTGEGRAALLGRRSLKPSLHAAPLAMNRDPLRAIVQGFGAITSCRARPHLVPDCSMTASLPRSACFASGRSSRPQMGHACTRVMFLPAPPLNSHASHHPQSFAFSHEARRPRMCCDGMHLSAAESPPSCLSATGRCTPHGTGACRAAPPPLPRAQTPCGTPRTAPLLPPRSLRRLRMGHFPHHGEHTFTDPLRKQ